MSFHICLKSDKSLSQLAAEVCQLLSLPPFQENSLADEPYYQFEVFGMSILLHRTDEEDREPEVIHYPYSLDIHYSFLEHNLDTDDLEYRLQPYYAQLLSFHLGLDTAHFEKQKIDRKWQIRYHFYSKNSRWNPNILFGEPGWQPAVTEHSPTPWRFMHSIF